MAVTTFGSITVIDVNDLSELSVYPMANMPLSVIHNPDSDSYSPDWSENTLTLTPVVYYGGEQLALGGTGLRVTWQRQDNTSAPVDTSTAAGETLRGGGYLDVTANKFTDDVVMVTYIVTAKYVEPTSQKELVAKGQITFSLIKQSVSVKNCAILGETVFKYDKDLKVTPATITLTKRVSDTVSAQAWKYKSGNNWVVVPGSSPSSDLTVSPSNKTLFPDGVNMCTIKLETNDANVYDLHVITKLYDGTPGDDTITAILTNEDQMIPLEPDSATTAVSGASTDLIIYEGTKVITDTYTIALTDSGSDTIKYTPSANNSHVEITEMTGTNAYVTFTATRTGKPTLTKTFSLVGVRAGADGITPTIYSVDASSLTLTRDPNNNGALTPANVTFYAYQQTGTNAKTAYTGRFEIYENTTLAQYNGYTAAQRQSNRKAYSGSNSDPGDTASYTYTPTANATSILCVLYKAQGFTDKLDAQTVIINSDGLNGKQGAQGPTGPGAINVILGNYSDVIPCTSGNRTSQEVKITIPFDGYKGTDKVACSMSSANRPNLVCNTNTSESVQTVTPTYTAATTSVTGSLVYTIPQGTLIDAATRSLSLKFSCAGKTITHQYSWSRDSASFDAVVVQVATPNGYVFNKNGNQTPANLPINAYITDGSTDVTNTATYQWYKFSGGTYSKLTGKTSSVLSVASGDVDGYASYKCEIKYNNNTYNVYASLMDKTDPLQCTVLSSVGSQIVNKQGVGALYVRVTQNGIEIDELKSEVFSETAPASATNGDYYWKLDKTNKTVTLMKYSSSKWSAAPASDTTYNCDYKWYYRDKDGNRVTPTGLATAGKVVYIDGSLISGKLTADVEVTYPKPTS